MRTEPQPPTFTPGPWLSRRWAAKRALEEKRRVELERQDHRRRLFPERPRHAARDGGAVERWLNWITGFLFGWLFFGRR
jgi:hypothetical protein